MLFIIVSLTWALVRLAPGNFYSGEKKLAPALGITAYLIALLVGITMGTFAALRQNSWLDYASMALAMLGISIPNFVLGPLLVLMFSLTLFWFPPALWNGFA